MKGLDLLKTGTSIVVILALAILIVNVNQIIAQPAAAPKTDSNHTTIEAQGDCFSSAPDTVVFVHSNSCPHCRAMVPIIEELENEGYKFYWAEGSDSDARAVIEECFSDVLGGYVPQFICAGSLEERTGEMSKEELRAFAAKCAQ